MGYPWIFERFFSSLGCDLKVYPRIIHRYGVCAGMSNRQDFVFSPSKSPENDANRRHVIAVPMIV